ncbi:MAG: UDP-N-acetylmuramoyl-L-alanine--D-glutamate ligase [Anaerorhabdus sp.]
MLEVRNKGIQELQNKKILIWGFGREGKSTLKFLQQMASTSTFVILDDNEIKEAGILCLRDADFDEYDLIFKSPGIVIQDELFPFEKLTSQTTLFMGAFHSQIIAITGTKGKSTTSSLMHHVLKESKKDVLLVGNIGVPCLDVWDSVKEDTVIVFEISCHQLEYIEQSAHIAVLLNLYPEHLDHYGTFEKYEQAKRRVYQYQTKDDFLIIQKELKPICIQEVMTCSLEEDADIKPTESGFLVNQKEVILPLDTKLIGRHNRYNAAIVYAIAQKIGLSEKEFLTAYASFRPLAHRLEMVGVYNGVTFVDDSISTIPQATIEALRSLPDVDTVLIGGMDRGIDYQPLVEFLDKSSVNNIILMYASGRKIALMNSLKKPVTLVTTLKEAVALAKKVTAPGKICLLSPSAASYGDFKNFEDRGEQFKELVKSYE